MAVKRKKSSKRKQPYKHGVPKKYTEGAKNPKSKAAEIKRTAAAYKRGEKLISKPLSAPELPRAKKEERRNNVFSGGKSST